MGSVIKKRRKRMSKKKHRKLLRKTRHQRRNKKYIDFFSPALLREERGFRVPVVFIFLEGFRVLAVWGRGPLSERLEP